MSASERELIEAAVAVQRNAYAPYSHFPVGAVVRSRESGALYRGANVENASYGLAMCAERSAIAQMVATGEREIETVVVASPGGVTPCGACRQVLAEFGSTFEVILFDSTAGAIQGRWSIEALLPGAFEFKSVKR